MIADVSGSGVSAALLMASVRAALHAEARGGRRPAGPGVPAQRLRPPSSEPRASSLFSTAISKPRRAGSAFSTPATTRRCSCGSDAGFEALVGTGSASGCSRARPSRPGRPCSSRATSLCLYTDGITESRTADKEEFGEDGLLAILRESARLSGREIVERIFEATTRFSGCEEPNDDATVVLVKRLAAGEKP